MMASVDVIAHEPTVEQPPDPQNRLRRLVRKTWLARVIVWGSFILAWDIVAVIKGPVFLPTPLATVKGLGKLVTEGDVPAVANSLKQLATGYLLAVLIGVPLGLLMGSVRALDDLFSPYINTLFIVSKEALLPFLIIIFGTRFTFRATVVFLFAIFFIVMNTSAGVKSVDRRLVETARAFGVPKRQIFSKVVVPASLPFVIAGLRLGLSTAIKGMVIAEIWVTIGIGLLLENFSSFLRLDLFFALSFVIVGIGVVSTTSLRALENKLRPWAQVPR
jgi:NitT/TauT family transport system permease protein